MLEILDIAVAVILVAGAVTIYAGYRVVSSAFTFWKDVETKKPEENALFYRNFGSKK